MMDVDANSSSDVEVLEEMNGSPHPSKRKIEDSLKPKSSTKAQTDSTLPKKPTNAKLAPTQTPSKPTSSTSTKEVKDKSKSPGSESNLVEFKSGKLSLKQKAANGIEGSLASLQGIMDLTTYFTTFFKDNEGAKFEEWPVEHHGFVARLIHESDKVLPSLARIVKKEVVKLAQRANPSDEESQESDSNNWGDRVAFKPIEALIETLATRNNFGLEMSDLPADVLPEDAKDLHQNVQLWRWEVNNTDLLPPELDARLSKRHADRVTAKSEAVALFLSLPSEEQTALLAGTSSSSDSATTSTKRPRTTDDSAPVASGSGSGSTSTSASAAPAKKKKVDKAETEEEKTAREEKAKLKEEEKVAKEERMKAKEKARVEREKEKEEKDKEKLEKKAAREKAAAEKEEKKAEVDEKKAEAAEKKAAREEKKAAKEAKEQKAKAENAKSASMMSMFVKKTDRSASPVPLNVLKIGKATGESDFNSFFRPFHVKADVKMAPINRFKKYKSGKAREVEFASRPDLTAEESIQEFLSDVPRKRLLPHNAHPAPKLSVREVVRAINESHLTGEDPTPAFKALADRKRVQVKFLKFKEDVRPGYVGTWTKTSRVVGPRTPFAMDTTLLRYDYDSEDEWEEDAEDDGEAENIASGDERSDDGKSDASLSDDWMCGDSEVEYADDLEDADEMAMDVDQEDDDMIVVGEARRKIVDREKKSKAARETAQKRKQVGPLVPIVKGPSWEKKVGETTDRVFAPMRIQFLNDATVGLDPFKFVSKPFHTPSTVVKDKAVTSSTPSLAASSSLATDGGSTAKSLPTHLLSNFVKLVNGSTRTRPGLIDELFEQLKDEKPAVRKNTIDKTLKDLKATKEKGAAKGEQGVWKCDEGRVKALMAF